MVEFSVRVHPAQRQAYIPKAIVDALGHQLKFRPNSYAVVVYPEGVEVSLVIRSVELLLEELRLVELVEGGAAATRI